MAEDHLDNADLSCLRHLITAAPPCGQIWWQLAMPRFNYALETCFGQTEVPQIAVCMRANEWQDPQNYASTGRATVLTQIGIMDGEGQILRPVKWAKLSGR